MAVTIQTRRDDALDWTTANPVLALGEIGIETDTDKAKYGDGFTAWNDLEYWIGSDPIPTGTDTQTMKNVSGVWEATSDVVVDDIGNVGVGNATPERPLHIGSGAGTITSASTYKLLVENNAGVGVVAQLRTGDDKKSALYFASPSDFAGAQIKWGYDDDAFELGTKGIMTFSAGDASTERMRIDSSGNLLVGQTGAQVGGVTVRMAVNSGTAVTNGWERSNPGQLVRVGVAGVNSGGINITASGGTPSFYAGSDVALKEDIQGLEPQLANILALQPRTYKLKETGEYHTGFVAQEVEPILPDNVVEMDGTDMLGLSDMSPMTARLVKAIQEQQAQIDELRALIEGAP